MEKFDAKNYLYGIKSYVFDNLKLFESDLKSIKLSGDKTAKILFGFYDLNEEKIYKIGTGKGDIISVQNIFCDRAIEAKNSINIVLNSLKFSNSFDGQVVCLKEKQYVFLNKNLDYVFGDENIKSPKNPQTMQQKIEFLAYFCAKLFCSLNLEDIKFLNTDCYFDKGKNIIVCFLTLKILSEQNEVLKVLTKDYNHRLKISLKEIKNQKELKLKQENLDDLEEEKNPQNFYYSRKSVPFLSVDAVVMQFVVSLCLFNKSEKVGVQEITKSLNQKLETNEKFKTILNRVIKGLNEFKESDIQTILDKFLSKNEELELSKKQDKYFVKNFGENYERIKKFSTY
ncbi:MAG: hypothetical protein IJ837_01325 [Clostridia bacterium]|nr:hypothetical protein [Clostridia bacterium]